MYLNIKLKINRQTIILPSAEVASSSKTITGAFRSVRAIATRC
jgi:hypothetical protein